MELANYKGLISIGATEPVFGVYENLNFARRRLDMILFDKRITKAQIRLRGCAGWSVPLLFAIPEEKGFLRRGLFMYFEIEIKLKQFRIWKSSIA